MHAPQGTEEKTTKVHLMSHVCDPSYPGFLHIHSDDENVSFWNIQLGLLVELYIFNQHVQSGFFTYGDENDELKCQWSDDSQLVYNTFDTKINFMFAENSIIHEIRHHYDHKDLLPNLQSFVDSFHYTLYDCKFDKVMF